MYFVTNFLYFCMESCHFQHFSNTSSTFLPIVVVPVITGVPLKSTWLVLQPKDRINELLALKPRAMESQAANNRGNTTKIQ